jgi:hypothetical protein
MIEFLMSNVIIECQRIARKKGNFYTHSNRIPKMEKRERAYGAVPTGPQHTLE